MKTFDEYQALATALPAALRNNRDRIDLPVLGLQEEAGKVGALMSKAFASGKFDLGEEQNAELKDRLSDILWYLALLSNEAGLTMQDLSAHSAMQIQARFRDYDSEKR